MWNDAYRIEEVVLLKMMKVPQDAFQKSSEEREQYQVTKVGQGKG